MNSSVTTNSQTTINRTATISDTRLIRSRLMDLQRNINFFRFDSFMVQEFTNKKQMDPMGEVACTKEENVTPSAGERKSAFQNFMHLTKGKKIADYHTISKWFGIGGTAVPKREHLFKMALALKFTPQKLSWYFVYALQEPDVQVNDYEEIIYLYGITNHLSCEECQEMISVFAVHMNKEVVVQQSTHTEKLQQMFQENCQDRKEDFLVWMFANAGMFKGYSKTALNYFCFYKKSILDSIRHQAKETLFQLLEDTTFFAWVREEKISEDDYSEAIKRYIRNQARRGEPELTAAQIENILESHWVAYSSGDKNTDMLAELYASAIKEDDVGNTDKAFSKKGKSRLLRPKIKQVAYKQRELYSLPGCLHFMTNKYVSQLLGVAVQKEQQMRLSSIAFSLEACDEVQVCPAWICQELNGMLKRQKEILTTLTVKEAKKLVAAQLKKQNRACQLVKRQDLLPLIHYVAQNQYWKQLAATGEEYNYKEAVELFQTMADSTLTSCSMATLNPKYHLDYLLLACYGEEDMFSLSDIIEKTEV